MEGIDMALNRGGPSPICRFYHSVYPCRSLDLPLKIKKIDDGIEHCVVEPRAVVRGSAIIDQHHSAITRKTY